MDSLKLTPRQETLGCGIYEAGDTDKCFTKLFVTESGRVLPINHRVITEEDLMEVYKWGRLDERGAQAPIATPNFCQPEGHYFNDFRSTYRVCTVCGLSDYYVSRTGAACKTLLK